MTRCLTLLLIVLTCQNAVAQKQVREAFPGQELLLHTGQSDYQERRDTHGSGDRQDVWVTGVKDSSLRLFLPKGTPSAAVVICPGGGYAGLSYVKEGTYVAEWFCQRGVAAAVLKYRTGGGANRHPAPRDDVQLALQTVRSLASKHGYPRDKVGVMGFSAGGHLAATAATHFKPADPSEQAAGSPAAFSSRPDFAVLVYPVISVRKEVTHGGSRDRLLGAEPAEGLIHLLSLDEQVTEQTPPTFLVHSTDDRAVPVQNATRFYLACVKHRVPAELHVFEKGGHGYGMWRDDLPVKQWPDLLQAWLQDHRWMQEP